MARYNDVNNGYDGKFNSYRKAMKKSMPQQLRSWVHWLERDDQFAGKGQIYFDCSFDGYKDYQGPCPVPKDVIGPLLNGYWRLGMSLRDKDGFERGLAEIGMSPDWIYFGDDEERRSCIPTQMPTGCADFVVELKGVPMIKDDWQMPNPKDLVQDVLPKVETLRTELFAKYFELSMGLWEGYATDVVDVMAMPIFLLKQAVDAMSEAKEIGEEIQEEERKNLILTIISAILFFVPVVGQYGAAAAGMVATARAFMAAGVAGNLALTIVDIIENPESAPMAIAGLLMGGGGRIRGPSQFRAAARAKNSMSQAMRQSTGKVYLEFDDVLQRVLKNACRRG